MTAFAWIVVALLSVPAVLSLIWFAEIVAGCLSLLRKPVAHALPQRAFRTAILIPAHNEGTGLLPTIQDALAQLQPGDRILVVADNCADDTAEVARAAGTDVVVRTDPARRGKGYALEYGVRELAKSPPDVVIVMDADCRIAKDAIGILAHGAMATQRPAQALYFMEAPEGGAVRMNVSEFAYRMRNLLRPLGMHLAGLPVPLFGTGMAFPYKLIAGRDLGNSRLAEDTALGLSLASERSAPIFYPEAKIYSQFPTTQKAADAQRLRWEKGNFSNVVDLVPGSLAKAIARGNVQLAALALDLAVPPLAMLALLTFGCVILGAATYLLGGPVEALLVPTFGAAVLLAGGALSWVVVGRDIVPLKELVLLPAYLFRKIFFYRAWASGKTSSGWVKTDRG